MKYLWATKTKRMSLNHWRFRLLHWTFGIKNPKPGNPLHSAFYHHYCPLFHATNFLVAILPLIIMGKTVRGGCSLAKQAFQWMPKPRLPRLTDEQVNRSSELRSIKDRMFERFGEYLLFEEFSDFWLSFGGRYQYLNRAEVEAEFNRHLVRYMKAEERKKRKAARAASWSAWFLKNSKPFETAFFWMLIAALSCLAVGLAAIGGLGIYKAAVYMWHVGFPAIWEVLNSAKTWAYLGTVLGIAVFFGTLIVVCAKGTIKFAESKYSKIAGRMLAWPFTWIVGYPLMKVYDGGVVVARFVADFYNESCPPIELEEVSA